MTGTDTDVGKTRMVAALARACAEGGSQPTIVKLVQTGVAAGAAGDADEAGALAGCAARELFRFDAPLDPWSAAVEAGRAPPTVAALIEALREIPAPVVAETAGGLEVPLNAEESFASFAERAGCAVILVVGLRLGCINHALLTAARCAQSGLPLVGAVLVERWTATPGAYRRSVERALGARLPLLGLVPFDSDAARSVAGAAKLFAPIAAKGRA